MRVTQPLVSAASVCRQVAAWVQDIFCNFYLVKTHKIGKDLTAAIKLENKKHRLGILRILEYYLMCPRLNLKTIKVY
jgi:hypothetical protein